MLIGDYFKNIKSEYKNYFFSGISFNSLGTKKNNIFFAVKGVKTDGRNYITSAIKKGAKIIISENKFEGLKNDILYLSSTNVRKLLSETAYNINKDKPKNLIAVTGTNGKSSIAEFYYQILRLNNKKVASIGTLGVKSHVGTKKVINTTQNPIMLSKSLQELKKQKIENVILEASSHGLKQNRLDGLLFSTGIFTNLSHDHLDYHKNIKNYFKSKIYLFENLIKKKGNLIMDQDIVQFKTLKNISIKKKLHLTSISGKGGSLELISHKFKNESQLIKIKYKNNFYNFKCHLIGNIQIKNILMAMLAAEKSNLNIRNIVKVISKIRPTEGRLERIGKLKNNSKVILDYAHTPDALMTCLKNIKDQFKNKKISIVFGCGGERDETKRIKMGSIADYYCDKIYLTDDNPRNENPKKIRNEIKKKIKKFKLYEILNRASAISEGIKNLKTGEILIVAGKGHEKIQDYGNRKFFFSDKDIILKSIKIKNKSLSKDLKINILKEYSKNILLPKNLIIKNASINSKKINKNDIFFAIKGKKKDGNLYIKEALKRKASLVVVSKINKKLNLSKQIKVNNTLNFLTKSASLLRENLESNIISITGSCGKTSLKELLGTTLKKLFKVTYSPKSFNNKYGVPLSLFNLNKKDVFGIFEIGMDKKGEIDNLSKIVKPDVGIITNISFAHAKNFKNIKEIASAKAEIMNNIKHDGSIILNADDTFFNYHRNFALKKGLNIYSFGIKNSKSYVKLLNILKEKNKFKLIINIGKRKTYFYTRNNFENNLMNILAAITAMSLYFEVSKLDKNIFLNFKTPSGRGDTSKIKINEKNIFLVDESYNSNPLSLKSAIKNFEKIKVKNSKKHLILGDMLELGKHSKNLHASISNTINKSSIKNVHIFGKDIHITFKNIKKSKKGQILQKKSHIIDLIKNNINNNDYLMIKGSNSTGLHKISNAIKKGNINAL
jgi:murE/murF fusion protein